MNCHLVILKKKYLDLILSGNKTVESRFTHSRKEPFGRVAEGDRIFLKQSSGPVCAISTIGWVETFESLTPAEIRAIKKEYNHLILGEDSYWREKSNCRFGVLVAVKEVEKIEPFSIDKKDWRAWVVLKEGKDFGLLNKF